MLPTYIIDDEFSVVATGCGYDVYRIGDDIHDCGLGTHIATCNTRDEVSSVICQSFPDAIIRIACERSVPHGC